MDPNLLSSFSLLNQELWSSTLTFELNSTIPNGCLWYWLPPLEHQWCSSLQVLFYLGASFAKDLQRLNSASLSCLILRQHSWLSWYLVLFFLLWWVGLRQGQDSPCSGLLLEMTKLKLWICLLSSCWLPAVHTVRVKGCRRYGNKTRQNNPISLLSFQRILKKVGKQMKYSQKIKYEKCFSFSQLQILWMPSIWKTRLTF